MFGVMWGGRGSLLVEGADQVVKLQFPFTCFKCFKFW